MWVACGVLIFSAGTKKSVTLLRRNNKKARELAQRFPSEIMLDSYARRINDLTISEYIKYLIGWSDLSNPELGPYFIDKGINF